MINLPILNISKPGDDDLLQLKKWWKEGQHQKTHSYKQRKDDF